MGPSPGVSPTDPLTMEMKGSHWGQWPCPPSAEQGEKEREEHHVGHDQEAVRLYLGAWHLWGPLDEGASEEAGRWRCLFPTLGQAQGPRAQPLLAGTLLPALCFYTDRLFRRLRETFHGALFS